MGVFSEHSVHVLNAASRQCPLIITASILEAQRDLHCLFFLKVK